MARGILSGMIWGSIVSVAVLGTASLMLPLSAPATGGNAGASPSPYAPPEAETASAPAASAGRDAAEKGREGLPAAPGLAIPAGSEFRRAPPEAEVALPSQDGPPPASSGPVVAQPGAVESGVPVSGAGGTVRPEVGGPLVAVPHAPATEALRAIAAPAARSENPAPAMVVPGPVGPVMQGAPVPAFVPPDPAQTVLPAAPVGQDAGSTAR
ncbi:hypothetical protein [Tropicimonas sp.]|uniref:hypothetical protein n=1 Tax=Tropicimonas sp. TaxID=2067044 RepID=UPI003A84D973